MDGPDGQGHPDRSGIGRHSPAFIGAFAAGFGAGFAVGMVGRMFFALVGAGFADFGAEYHEVTHEFRATRFQPTAEGAYIGAVAAELDTGRHVMPFAIAVAHFDTGGDAAFAGFGAFKAGVGVFVVVVHRFHERQLRVGRPPLASSA